MVVSHDDDEHAGWPAEIARRWGLLAEDVRRRLGPGASLEPRTRSAFEGRLGGDLSSVMVHRSPLAGRLARSLGAEALSAGTHVLGGDELDASTPGGVAVLGHELTHVVQRDVADPGASEASAQLVERQLATDGTEGAAATGAASGGAGVDPDALADRVYERMMDQLRLDRERGAWIA
jgi:hypothetical protein